VILLTTHQADAVDRWWARWGLRLMATTTVDESPRKHVLLTRETCTFTHYEDRQCPVCDGGLAVCANCGKAEIELDDPVCRGVNH